MTASNIADRHAWLHRLSDDRQLLFGAEASPPGNARDHLDTGNRVGHRYGHRLTLRLSGQRRCPVESGSSSAGTNFTAPHSPIARPIRKADGR